MISFLFKVGTATESHITPQILLLLVQTFSNIFVG